MIIVDASSVVLRNTHVGDRIRVLVGGSVVDAIVTIVDHVNMKIYCILLND